MDLTLHILGFTKDMITGVSPWGFHLSCILMSK